MLQDFLIPFITIGIAELGDKTQLIVFTLAGKHKKPIQLLIGATLAFLAADAIAIFLGAIIQRYVDLDIIKLIGGLLFIGFGVFTLIKKEKEEDIKLKKKKGMFLFTAFIIVFIAEMGDKTQLAAGLFATQYNPYLVLLGAVLAESLLSALAIFLGKAILKHIDEKKVAMIAGILFILIGILMVVNYFGLFELPF